MNKLKSDFEKSIMERESIILVSREIIQLSKKIISFIHNNQPKEANVVKKQIVAKVKGINKKEHFSNPNYSIAMQEYIEAIMLLEYAKTGKVLSYEKINCNPNEYILGLIDFVGELQRRSVLEISRGNEKELPKIYKDVTKIYNDLLNYSFRGNIRKKFDSVKYIMIKMEDLMLQIKLKK